MNVIGTGLSGLVGSRVAQLLSSTLTFEDIGLETGIDITDQKSVTESIHNSKSQWVFHFAAKTDVEGAEVEASQGVASSFWKVNVTATETIVEACRISNKHLLYVSTDYVFDGTLPFYTETSTPNPQGWYAKTKYEGEKRVAQLGDRGLIIRIANPYRANPIGKLDFVHKILELLRTGVPIQAPSDQLFIPTFIDDIAYAILSLVTGSATGVYHVVGSQAISPFEGSKLIARIFDLDESLIRSTTFREYFQTRAPRPFLANLINDKIKKSGVKMSTFEEGLLKVKLQEQSK